MSQDCAPTVTALTLVVDLTQALSAAGLDYCHWKSNDALDRSASADNDLDLLVGRADAGRFSEILHRFGFKHAEPPPAQRLPGVRDFYGYDAPSGRLVHVHLHFQLVLGHDRSKNFRLTMERPFLDSASQRELFRVPEPAFDLIVFVVRMTLKYATWDALLSGQGRVPAGAREELAFLRSRVDRERLAAALPQCLPTVSQTLFEVCERAIDADCPRRVRVAAGRRLQRALRASARRPAALDLAVKHGRRLERGLRRRLGRLPKKRLVNGGAMIALVGGDGAGKSTAIAGLSDWLGGDFDILKVHLGRPPRSWTTSVVRAALRAGRALSGAAAGARPVVYSPLIWQVCTARDRYRTYRRARRFADNGGLVICDRFPLPNIKLMDGPQLPRLTADAANRVTRLLTRLEQSWYRAIVEPEILFVLKVDPDVAVSRKTDEVPGFVRPRSEEIWRSQWRDSRAHVIDAGRPAAQVLSEIKTIVWDGL